jgi:hypothetical protein
MTNLGVGRIELVPLSPVCDANPSCPVVDPASCPLSQLTCSFTSPAAAPSGTYDIVVVDAGGADHLGTFDVVASGGVTSCTL